MFTRLIYAFVLVMVLLAGAGGYWIWSTQTPPPAAYAGPTDSIRIANIGVYSVLNLLADEQGYFAENGLDATITEYDSGATSIAALNAGEADVAIAADFVGVFNLFSHPDLRILAEVGNQEVFSVIARADREIAVSTDLRGKQIGVTRGTAGEYYLGRFLAFAGLGYADVDVVDLRPVELVAQLEEGALDAIVIFEPHVHELAARLAGEVIVWSAQGNQRARAMAYARQVFVTQHPAVIERYLRALVQAEDFLHAYPEEARALIMRRLNFTEETMAALEPKLMYEIRLAQDTLLTLEDQARWMIATELTDETAVPNYLSVMYFRALEQVRPEAITIVH